MEWLAIWNAISSIVVQLLFNEWIQLMVHALESSIKEHYRIIYSAIRDLTLSIFISINDSHYLHSLSKYDAGVSPF